MSMVGSNFSKIHVERLKPLKGKVNINNNVAIKDVQETEMDLGESKQKGLKFLFSFLCKYEPGVGTIDIEGELLVIEKEDFTKALLKSWKDKKEIPKEYMANILNAVLTKCNVQALILSQTMGLPPPIPMPKISDKGEQ